MSSVSENGQGCTAAPSLADIPALVRFSAAVTETLRLEDGVYCFDREWAEAVNRGRSPRYTLMVALGFARAEAAGYDGLPRTAREQLDAAIADRSRLSIGDRGLALWVLARLGDARATEWVTDLEGVTAEDLRPLEGMEIGWLVTGAAAAVEAGLPAERLLAGFLAQLRSRRARKSPLFHHLGTGRGRALLPNFATQIYSVLALADVARITNDQQALGEATALADLLVELRGPDCGWPWLFHAEKGRVVETYQVYSVHQDAMAPMAYFALGAATGNPRYATAGAEGLPWCFGENELGLQFYDVPACFAHRAIKRGGWADRAELWANTLTGVAGLRPRVRLGKPVVNTTCRPYHLGWVMEAWAGREANIELLGRAR
ncbi:MAG: hypothetical protein H6836_10255 [Planctomycetes bacterium]|nr:hypothetical protein [Planctomycetota bacterium]